MRATNPEIARSHSGIAGAIHRGKYVVAVMAMIVVVLLGFWPFYAALARGGSGAHWLLYLHAAVFSGWMVLLLTQVLLVAFRRSREHQRLGKFGISYGALVVLMGLVISFAAPALNVAAGRSTLDEAAGFLILPLGDMLLFGAFFSAGIATRCRPEIHRQWMVLASIALIYPGAARFGDPYGLAVIIAIWLLPLGLLMIHELATRGRVGRIYLIGAAILLAALLRLPAMQSEGWLVIGRGLLRPFIPAA
ncbi:MAG: hypothetical protein ACYC2K_14090 [Gemmatimonadales bacterium]